MMFNSTSEAVEQAAGNETTGSHARVASIGFAALIGRNGFDRCVVVRSTHRYVRGL